MTTKYAIKIPFPPDFLYLTYQDGKFGPDNIDNIKIKLFDTKEEAELHAKAWKNYKVVPYSEEECDS